MLGVPEMSAEARMFKSILIPIDASTNSQNAAMVGLEFARKLGASVRIIHVLQQRVMYPLQVETFYDEDARAQGEEIIKPWTDHAERLGVPCETTVIESPLWNTGEAIVEAAKERACDLIVMGTHGREGLGRLMVGSVAERVSRLATQPVMLVRSAATNNTNINPFEKLFVPVDGSDSSAMALGVAHELCRQLNSSLEIAHVVPDLPIPLTNPVGAYAAFDYAGLAKTLEESGHQILSNAVKNTTLSKVSSKLVLADGQHISAAILKAARAASSDLIVIGTHGRSGMDRLLLGSVAEGVIHHAEVPVLLVRSPVAKPS
jgi:nucleotide-binding universal stress UspA family protein